MSQQTPMTPTTASTNGDNVKCEIEDGVVPNKTLVIASPTPGGDDEKSWSGDGPGEPSDVVVKDLGPPDGGYGWVVVAYLLVGRLVLIIELFAP